MFYKIHKNNSVSSTMFLKLTIKVVAFFLGHLVYRNMSYNLCDTHTNTHTHTHTHIIVQCIQNIRNSNLLSWEAFNPHSGSVLSLPAVLHALCRPPFKPLGQALLYHLTLKTLFLIDIASGRHAGSSFGLGGQRPKGTHDFLSVGAHQWHSQLFGTGGARRTSDARKYLLS